MPCSTPGRPPAIEAACLPRFEAMAGRLDAVNPDVLVVEERMKQAHGVRAAADAGDQRIRQPAFGSSICSRVSRPMIDWKSRTIIG